MSLAHFMGITFEVFLQIQAKQTKKLVYFSPHGEFMPPIMSVLLLLHYLQLFVLPPNIPTFFNIFNLKKTEVQLKYDIKLVSGSQHNGT